MIVGLGNPGAEHRRNRHNVGFMVADFLVSRWDAPEWKSNHQALVTERRNQQERLLLVKPQTYMNLSGVAVGLLSRWHKIAPQDVIVIYDDMDLPIGKLRIRTQGASGGHKGVESILMHLSEGDFVRLRVGIGRPLPGQDVISHVLNDFSSEQQPLIEQIIKNAAEAVESILSHGVQAAMERYNGR